MDRFLQELPSLVSHMRKLMGDEDFDSLKVEYFDCENCGRSVQKVLHVPEFDYLGCEDCYDEAMRVLAREEAEKITLAPVILARQHKGMELAVTSARDIKFFQQADLSPEEMAWITRSEFRQGKKEVA